MSFYEMPVTELSENFIRNIGEEWMLITAGNQQQYNMMTASWGFAGYMWGEPTAIAAIRPQRYTMKFVEQEETYTLSFYGADKKIHSICGKQSGRDINKTVATGLTPQFDTTTGAPYFKEARLVLICQKVYQQKLSGEGFFSKEIPDATYADGDYHHMIYGRIIKALVKNEE